MVHKKLNFKIVKLAMAIIILLTFTGCSIKQDDDLTTKTAKHIVNSPAYVIIGAGALATAAGGLVGYSVSKGVDKLAGVELYLGETHLGKSEESILDNNASLAKFYADDNYALYKDSENENYMLQKSTGDVIKGVKFGHKRWSIASFDNRPTLPIKTIHLQSDLDKEYLYSKFKTDKFGNYLFLGNSVILKVQQYRAGLFLTKHTKLFLIEDGTASIGKYDHTIPPNLKEQLEYFFPKKES